MRHLTLKFMVWQREEMRAKFPGVPADLVNYFLYVAEEVCRVFLASCLSCSCSSVCLSEKSAQESIICINCLGLLDVCFAHMLRGSDCLS